MTASDLTPVARLTRDIKAAAIELSQNEARFLVDSYYQMQDARIRASHQARTLDGNDEPHAVISYLAEQNRILESQVQRALDAFSDSHHVGRWSRSHKGIGPVIAAGLLAHIDISRAPTAGHIWNYAGLNPGVVWEKGQRRPWNADLKTLCWKMGESFVKVSGMDDSIYGRLYAERKVLENNRNDAGEFSDQAEHTLATKKIGKETDAYKSYSKGKLPPAHIHARAKRFAVKLFLSHWHHIAFEERYNEAPPKPYAMAVLEHAHYMAPQWGDNVVLDN